MIVISAFLCGILIFTFLWAGSYAQDKPGQSGKVPFTSLLKSGAGADYLSARQDNTVTGRKLVTGERFDNLALDFSTGSADISFLKPWLSVSPYTRLFAPAPMPSVDVCKITF